MTTLYVYNFGFRERVLLLCATDSPSSHFQSQNNLFKRFHRWTNKRSPPCEPGSVHGMKDVLIYIFRLSRVIEKTSSFYFTDTINMPAIPSFFTLEQKKMWMYSALCLPCFWSPFLPLRYGSNTPDTFYFLNDCALTNEIVTSGTWTYRLLIVNKTHCLGVWDFIWIMIS